MRAGRGRVRPPLPFHPPRRCSTVGGGVLAPRPRDLGEGGGGGTAAASGRRAPSSRGGGRGRGRVRNGCGSGRSGAERDPQSGGGAGACREWGEARPRVPPPCQPLGGSGGRCVRAKACAERRARVPSGSAAVPVGSRAVAAGRTLPGVRLPRVPGDASELPAPLRGTARPGPPCSAAGLALRSGRRAVHRARLCSLPGRHRCLPACAVTQFRVPRELRGASPSEIFTSGRDTALGSRLSVAQVERVAGEGGSSNCCCSDSVRPGKERLPCPTPEVQSTPAYALTRAMRKVAHLTWKEQRHTALNT